MILGVLVGKVDFVQVVAAVDDAVESFVHGLEGDEVGEVEDGGVSKDSLQNFVGQLGDVVHCGVKLAALNCVVTYQTQSQSCCKVVFKKRREIQILKRLCSDNIFPNKHTFQGSLAILIDYYQNTSLACF